MEVMEDETATITSEHEQPIDDEDEDNNDSNPPREDDREDPDHGYGALNPEQKRALNVQRQKQYLDQLLGISVTSAVVPTVVQPVTIQNINRSVVDTNRLLAELQSSFPAREKDILKVVNFLRRPYVLPDSLLVTGCTGSGKSVVIRTTLTRLQIRHCDVLCSGFSSARQLLRAIWLAVYSTPSTTSGGGGGGGNCVGATTKKRPLAAPGSYSKLHCSSYEDFVMNCATAIHEPVVIFLDRVDAADILQAGLTEKLLALPTVCNNTLIKVVAASVFGTMTRCFRVHLAPYLDLQLEAVLRRQAEHTVEDADRRERLLLVIFHGLGALLLGSRHCSELWSTVCTIIEQWDVNMELNKANIDKVIRDRQSSPTLPKGCRQNTNPLLGDRWIEALSQTSKCLLLAAHCAANNHKGSDSYLFGVERRGKRRRAVAGTTEAGEAGGEKAAEGHVFFLERLVSIFLHVCASVGANTVVGGEEAQQLLRRRSVASSRRDAMQEVVQVFGDTYFFAALNSLVSCRLLSQGPGWSIENASFSSNVSEDMANDLAKAMDFDLNAYLLSK